jgi:hypothetical protein
MRPPLLAFCVSSVFFLACATSSAAAPASEPKLAAPAGHTLIASLERSPCYGRCPAYTVRVFADGAVEFDGRQFVGTLGPSRGVLSAAQVAALQQAFATAQFDALKPAYRDTRTTDLPWVTVSNGSKSVHHYTGDESAPPALTELEATIDRLVGTSTWVLGPEL